MTDLESLRSLQKRIREAKGADRELDARISCALLAPDGSYVEQSKFNFAWCIYDGTDSRGQPRLWEPRDRKLVDLYRQSFTTDPDGIGACVALLEAVFHGALWSVWNMEHGPGARILCPGKSGAFHDGQYAEVDELSDWTPASVCHALIDCAVSALIAQEEAKERVG